ncbi:hypothetical protein WA026_005897 [Henosepilachna vigintioctopunctata]|uniref:Methyltransferase type 11 domain-containing protein n=1 Tax=Henosepilachna vigintioctopunctata TaxID=420089 RepID=A0AAW1U365_9CUCU
MVSSAFIFSAYEHHVPFVRGIARKYFVLFDWTKKKNMKIMDIGSGAAKSLFVTEPMLPRDYAEIVCVDKDPGMCQYVKSLEKDPRISIRQLDIQTENLPKDLKGTFDFLMSSYCFSYVVNFRQAFKNSSQLLKPGGELLFWWSKKNQLYEAYRELSHTDKWGPYLKEFKNWRHSYDGDDALEEVTRDFKQNGLEVIKIEDLNEETFENENIQIWLDAFSSHDSISSRIPKSDFGEYQQDLHKLILQFVIVDKKMNTTKVVFPSIVVAAKKVS